MLNEEKPDALSRSVVSGDFCARMRNEFMTAAMARQVLQTLGETDAPQSTKRCETRRTGSHSFEFSLRSDTGRRGATAQTCRGATAQICHGATIY
jgi:hypothetical protein